MIKFVGPLILVEDIAVSRSFYEDILELHVKYDFGVNVAFHGDLSIHLREHFQQLLGDPAKYPIVTKSHSGELYFECDDIEHMVARLQLAQVPLLHPLCEQPWGQRVIRCYDPDGHVLEIGETMQGVVDRLYQQGSTAAEIVDRTGMPLEFVMSVLDTEKAE